MRKYLLLVLVLLFVFTISIASADPPPENYCVIDESFCVSGYSQTQCEQDIEGQYYTPQSPEWPSIVTGCQITFCHLVNENYCEFRTGLLCTAPEGQIIEPTPEGSYICPGESQTVCVEGQRGPCLCGGNTQIDSTQFCCGGAASTTSCGGGETPTGGENPQAVCGNGVLEVGEICDSGRSDFGSCPSVPGQYCTEIACRCGVLPSDEGPYCSDSNPQACEQLPCTDDTELGINSLDVTRLTNINDLPALLISWTLDNSECSQVNALLKQFDISDSNAPPVEYDVTGSTNQQIENLQYNHEYQFQLIVSQTGQTLIEEVHYWVLPITCEGPRNSWCTGTETYFDCLTQSSGNCDGEDVCYDTARGHTCTQDYTESCETCNSGYEEFGEKLGDERRIEIEVIPGGPTALVSCEDARGTINQVPGVQICYLDGKNSAAQAYSSCGQVDSCRDYQQADVCLDNPCAVIGDCELRQIGQFQRCVSQQEQGTECEDLPREFCGPEGVCLWRSNPPGGAEPFCAPVTASCSRYSTQDACTGGTNYRHSPLTYAIEATSQNEYDYPKCVWQANNCIKDSNLDMISEFDSDFQSPRSFLRYDPTAAQAQNGRIEVQFSEQVESFKYYIRQGMCSSSQRNSELLQRDGNVQGFSTAEITWADLSNENYCIIYSATDRFKNLEELGMSNLRIDSTDPSVLNISGFSYRTLQVLEIGSVYYSDLEIQFNTTIPTYCTSTISGPTSAETRINNQYGSTFGSIIRELADGEYLYLIQCEGLSPREYPVLVDFDTRISDPFPGSAPAVRTLTSAGVYTQGDASCQFNQGTWTALTKFGPDSEGKYRHQGFGTTFPQATGHYSLPVRCMFANGNGQYVTGGSADNIRYTIDQIGPTLSLSFNWQDSTIDLPNNPAQLPPSEDAITVNVRCTDVPISGEGTNHEAGATRLRISGDDATSPATTTIEVLPEEEYVLSCLDALGNEGASRTVIGSLIDDYGPRAPEFEIVNEVTS